MTFVCRQRALIDVLLVQTETGIAQSSIGRSRAEYISGMGKLQSLLRKPPGTLREELESADSVQQMHKLGQQMLLFRTLRSNNL